MPADGDPLANLAARLPRAARRYSPVQHDLRKPKEQMLLERMRDAARRGGDHRRRQDVRAGARRAGGLRARRSTRRGIPYFVTEFEENMTSFDSLQIQLETFVENLLFA